MVEKQDISTIFLESFLRRIVNEIVSREDIVNKKRIEKIKSKIDVYESPHDAFITPEEDEFHERDIPVPRPPMKNQMVKSMFEVKEPDESFSQTAPKKISAPVQRPPIVQRVQPQTQQFQRPPALHNQQIPVPRPTFTQRKETRPIMNPSRPMVIPNNSPVKDNMTPSIGITVVNQDLTGVPSIDKILQDAEVKTVECPGPNKQVLVYKGGKIQAANLTLTADEINNIMGNFSKKARIPIGNGFFKAAIDQFIVTSVMSEFVGTRFIIQRKPQVPSPMG